MFWLKQQAVAVFARRILVVIVVIFVVVVVVVSKAKVELLILDAGH